MATPRQLVAAQITQDQPGWIVHEHPTIPANVGKGKPVVSVWRSDVKPGASPRFLGHGVTINVYAAKRAGAEAEDELDDLLDGIMLSIERLGGFTLEAATRQSFANDAFAGWQIQVAMQSPNVYRQAIQEERSTP